MTKWFLCLVKLWSQAQYDYDTTRLRYDYEGLRFCGHKYDTTDTRLRQGYNKELTC